MRVKKLLLYPVVLLCACALLYVGLWYGAYLYVSKKISQFQSSEGASSFTRKGASGFPFALHIPLQNVHYVDEKNNITLDCPELMLSWHIFTPFDYHFTTKQCVYNQDTLITGDDIIVTINNNQIKIAAKHLNLTRKNYYHLDVEDMQVAYQQDLVNEPSGQLNGTLKLLQFKAAESQQEVAFLTFISGFDQAIPEMSFSLELYEDLDVFHLPQSLSAWAKNRGYAKLKHLKIDTNDVDITSQGKFGLDIHGAWYIDIQNEISDINQFYRRLAKQGILDDDFVQPLSLITNLLSKPSAQNAETKVLSMPLLSTGNDLFLGPIKIGTLKPIKVEN